MRRQWFPGGLLVLLLLPVSQAGEKEWTDLFAKGLEAFKAPPGDWLEIAEVDLDAKNQRKFQAKEGKGVWYNGPKGIARDLYTKEKFGAIEVRLEFNLCKGSNSGIKFHGHYELALQDSFGKKMPDGTDCGGIYPRAELKPRYHHIDKGSAPLVNACKEPGAWQTLEATFLAPRFDKEGKKTANAKIVRALLNGKTIHENLELLTPTGDRWKNAEMAEGPIMLQGDHGPIAFRNVKVRLLKK